MACVAVLTALTVMLLEVFSMDAIRTVWEAVRKFVMFMRLSIAAAPVLIHQQCGRTGLLMLSSFIQSLPRSVCLRQLKMRRVGADREHRTGSSTNHFFRHAPEQHVRERSATMRTHDDEICSDVLSDCHNRLCGATLTGAFLPHEASTDE
jgi:hypothetical protein